MKAIHFTIGELVPLSIRNLIHEDVLWEMIDDKLIESLEALKSKFSKGSIVINSYEWAGDRTQSGLRTKNSKYYSETSQHSLGKAADCLFTAYSVDDVRNYILNNPDEFPYIGGIELGVSWLHIDVRPRKNGKILTFYP